MRAASEPSQVEALKKRCSDCESEVKPKDKARYQELERCLARSTACRAIPEFELSRLAARPGAASTTYYKELAAGSRDPGGDEWARLRRLADTAVFGLSAEEIQFAALSPDGRSLTNYGPCTLFFREDMIEFRTSLFESNTASWWEQQDRPVNVPAGYRSTWSDRALLGMAKIAPVLSADRTSSVEELILNSGTDTGKDTFLEVHVFGSYTLATCSRIVATRAAFGDLPWERVALRAKELGVELEEA